MKFKKTKPKTEKPITYPPLSQTEIHKRTLMTMPVPILLASLEATVNVLQARGINVVDWENKNRHLVQFRQLGGKCYFFASQKER